MNVTTQTTSKLPGAWDTARIVQVLSNTAAKVATGRLVVANREADLAVLETILNRLGA